MTGRARAWSTRRGWGVRPSLDPRLELARVTGSHHPAEAIAVSWWDGREIVFTATHPHDYDCLRYSLHDCQESVLLAEDARMGRVLGTLADAGGERLAASGSVAAVADWAAPLRVWDIATGVTLAIPVPDPVVSLVVTRSGLVAAGTIKGAVHVWDAATGERAGRLDAGDGYAHVVSLEHEGRDLAFTVCGDGRLWDLGTGARLGPPLEGLGASTAALAVVCGRLIAVTAHHDGRIWSWDVYSGEPWRAPIESGASLWPFSDPAVIGETLVVPTLHHVQLWDLPSGTALGHLPAATAASGVAAGSGGALFTLTSDRFKQGMLYRWRLDAPGSEPAHAGDITATAFAGQHLITGDRDGVLNRWRLADGRHDGLMLGHSGQIRAIACRDGLVFTGAGDMHGGPDNTIRRWRACDGSPQGEPIVATERGEVRRLVATEVGGGREVVVSAGNEGEVAMWDAATGERLAEESSGAYGPQGLAHGTIDGRPAVAVTRMFNDPVVLWDLAALESTTVHTDDGEVAHALCDVDGRPHVVSLVYDTELRRRDLATGEFVTLERSEHRVTAFAFALVRGTPVAAVARTDATVVLRDVATGAVAGGPFLLPNPAGALALSPDGRLAVCCDGDIAMMDITEGS